MGLLDNPVFILFLALIIDVTLGEFPPFLHPVVGMGKVISSWERFAPRNGHLRQFLYGMGMVLFSISLFALLAYLLLRYLGEISLLAQIICAALLLKSTFSVRELRRAALRIKQLLLEENIERARFELSSLVSRDTRNLSQPLLVAATVESVAENVCDSFVAPLFYFVLFGVPGAIAYRVCNTVDAMLGYHGDYEYLGKFAARLDDALNFIPARIAGLLMVAAASLLRKNSRGAWQTMFRDHAKTESPNAGWTMGAASGALCIQLEKVGHYKLGDARGPLSPTAIGSAVAMMQVTAILWAVVCLASEGVRFVLTS